MSRLELDIALRYLRSRRGSRLLSFITVIAVGGVVVGVSALILIIGVMSGLQYDLREKILVGSPDLRVLSWGSDFKMDRWRTTLVAVRETDGVVAAAPFVLTHGLMGVEASQTRSPVAMVGIEPQVEGTESVTPLRDHVISGDFAFRATDTSRAGIVIGHLLAREIQAQLGDKVIMASLASVKLDAVGAPQVDYMFGEVTGIVRTGMYEYDRSYVFMDITRAQRLAALGDAVTGLEIKTPDRWSAAGVKQALEQKLDATENYVETWQEQNRALFSALRLEKYAMGVILLLIVLVAAFNIVSVLTMLVGDKTREIGILRAMGLKAASVRRIFMLQGMFIGVVGTTLGLILGLGASLAVGKLELIPLSPEVYFIDHLPTRTEPVDVAVIVLASMCIAIVATWSPSQQAAKLYPIEAIRHE